jgi:hypothetical protein
MEKKIPMELPVSAIKTFNGQITLAEDMATIRKVGLLLSLITITGISSAGISGAISKTNRYLLLDSECMNRWNEKKSIVSAVRDIPERMSDDEIGMTEFVNKKLKSIGGIIRSTWSDYRILEIRERDKKVMIVSS